VNPQLAHALADGFTVSEGAGGDAQQAHADAGLRRLVAQGTEPICERLRPIFALIADQIHSTVCGI